MQWMDDVEKRREAIERAWALAKIDGRTRYVVCLDGWPIMDSCPGETTGASEWAEVYRTGRVVYQNTAWVNK
jgi:hypothetical protein